MIIRYKFELGFVVCSGGFDWKCFYDWIVWYFIYVDNFFGIIIVGCLLVDLVVILMIEVVYNLVKELCCYKVVVFDSRYLVLMVSDYVLFYIVVWLFMFYVVCKGYFGYFGGVGLLVYFGVVFGGIIDVDLMWCVSDGNVVVSYIKFSC